MLLLTRAILIISLLLQPLGGMLPQRCVAMPGPATLESMGMPAGTECGCCGGGEDLATIECPTAQDQYIGCNCKSSQREDPKTPPSDQKPRQIEHLFTATPVAVAVLVPAPAPSVRWAITEPVRSSGSHSVQSLLCVWLM